MEMQLKCFQMSSTAQSLLYRSQHRDGQNGFPCPRLILVNCRRAYYKKRMKRKTAQNLFSLHSVTAVCSVDLQQKRLQVQIPTETFLEFACPLLVQIFSRCFGFLPHSRNTHVKDLLQLIQYGYKDVWIDFYYCMLQ